MTSYPSVLEKAGILRPRCRSVLVKTRSQRDSLHVARHGIKVLN